MKAAIAIFAGLAMLMHRAHGDDWPQWRGPERDGVWREQGIATLFPPDGLRILWRAPAGGGWSSPVVVQGRVFLSDSEFAAPKVRERVRCFDAATGSVLWTYVYDVDYPEWALNAEQNGGPCATSAVVDGKVYTLGGNGEAMCLAAATGELLWRRDLGKDYQIATLSCRPSPLIDGDRLILLIGGKPGACVLALDRHTGRDRWKALDDSISNSSPIIVQAGGVRQLIVWTGDSVASLDPTTGATYWREPMTTSNNDDIATPVCAGDRLLISGLMFQLDAGKPASTILWPENRGASKRILSNTSTPLLAGDYVYSAVNAGALVCLDARTGQEVWRTEKGDRPQKRPEHPSHASWRCRLPLHRRGLSHSCAAHACRV
jgi:hypothetical protein